MSKTPKEVKVPREADEERHRRLLESRRNAFEALLDGLSSAWQRMLEPHMDPDAQCNFFALKLSVDPEEKGYPSSDQNELSAIEKKRLSNYRRRVERSRLHWREVAHKRYPYDLWAQANYLRLIYVLQRGTKAVVEE